MYMGTLDYNIQIYTTEGDMKRRPGNGIEGAMVCTCLGSLLCPLFYFLDGVSYNQSVYLCLLCPARVIKDSVAM